MVNKGGGPTAMMVVTRAKRMGESVIYDVFWARVSKAAFTQ